MKTSGTLDAILANFDDSNDIVVFTDIVPDPPIETVVAGIKSAGDKPISIVLSIGGGSAIDASKAMYYFARNRVPSPRLFSSPSRRQAELDLK